MNKSNTLPRPWHRFARKALHEPINDAGLLRREWDEDEELTDELHRIARNAKDPAE